MLRVNQNTRSVLSHFHFLISPPIILWSLAMAFALALLPMTLAHSQPTVLESASALLRDPSPAVRAEGVTQLARVGSAEATTQLINYYQREQTSDNALATARALANIGTPQAYQALLDALRRNQSAARHDSALVALREANDSVVPALTSALMDTEPSVRNSAAQLLGARKATAAADALLGATHDPDSGVRESAAWALGELGALSAIIRFEQLQIIETNPKVREAATNAEIKLKQSVASALRVPASDLRAVTIAPSTGQAYAVTLDTLYMFSDGAWQSVGRVPAVPLALAAGGPDGRTVYVYVGTSALGLYRSTDGGLTWNSIRAGLPNESRLTVTALATNPVDTRYVYMALATGSGAGQTALGIFRSNDAGQTWTQLANASREAVTTRLVLDATTPEYLFGQSDVGAWRYTLTR